MPRIQPAVPSVKTEFTPMTELPFPAAVQMASTTIASAPLPIPPPTGSGGDATWRPPVIVPSPGPQTLGGESLPMGLRLPPPPPPLNPNQMASFGLLPNPPTAGLPPPPFFPPGPPLLPAGLMCNPEVLVRSLFDPRNSSLTPSILVIIYALSIYFDAVEIMVLPLSGQIRFYFHINLS